MTTATPAEILRFYDPAAISTPFGEDGSRFHYGTDWAHAAGTPAPTPFHGEVVANGWQDGHGWYISIRLTALPDWYFSISHLREQSPLAVGTWLDPLRLVGIVGSTGQSTGPHAHGQLATRMYPWDHSGQTIDPDPLIRAALNGVPWISHAGIPIWTNPQPPIVPEAPAPVEPPPTLPEVPAKSTEDLIREILGRALTAAIDAA